MAASEQLVPRTAETRDMCRKYCRVAGKASRMSTCLKWGTQTATCWMTGSCIVQEHLILYQRVTPDRMTRRATQIVLSFCMSERVQEPKAVSLLHKPLQIHSYAERAVQTRNASHEVIPEVRQLPRCMSLKGTVLLLRGRFQVHLAVAAIQTQCHLSVHQWMTDTPADMRELQDLRLAAAVMQW